MDCSDNQLTSLEGGPKEFERWPALLRCDNNKLKSLKGCPKGVKCLYCKGNLELEDISDLPADCEKICISGCDNIRIFPVLQEQKMRFIEPTEAVQKRIRAFYDVVYEGDNDIIFGGPVPYYMDVQRKEIGHYLLDSL